MRGTVAGLDGSPPLGVSARLPPQRRGRDRAAPVGLASTGADHIGIQATVLAGRTAAAFQPGLAWPASYAGFDEIASVNDDRADYRST